jgi:hypothetical protein
MLKVSLKQEYENHKNEIHSLNSENLVLQMDYCKTYPVPKLPNSSYCNGQRVELFQTFRTNKTVTCDESSYGLNTSSLINCAPN